MYKYLILDKNSVSGPFVGVVHLWGVTSYLIIFYYLIHVCGCTVHFKYM